jgi:hypothetical protein
LGDFPGADLGETLTFLLCYSIKIIVALAACCNPINARSGVFRIKPRYAASIMTIKLALLSEKDPERRPQVFRSSAPSRMLKCRMDWARSAAPSISLEISFKHSAL